MISSRQIPPHQKCYICIHIFENTRPVLLVSRSDGDWQFLCGFSHDDMVAEGRVVGIGHVLDRDPTLRPLLDLPSGWEAERESAGGDWFRMPCAEPEI